MESSTGISIRRPPGIIAGLTAAWAIFGLFLALGHEMGGDPGALFQMVGVAFGIDAPYAVYIGFLLYMITAVIIGIIYSAITKRIKILYINSVLKAVGTGILAGIVVWGVLFLPINYLIMEPTLQKLLVESDPSSSQYAMAKNLIELSSNIFWGSLSLHIVFGGVMGFCARLAIAEGSIIHD
jgi:ABC-type phosphate transport system permease subunit